MNLLEITNQNFKEDDKPYKAKKGKGNKTKRSKNQIKRNEKKTKRSKKTRLKGTKNNLKEIEIVKNSFRMLCQHNRQVA